ncbi:MAG TPA: hypothetical protein VF297_06115 [Pyrinomonadaceae bacterium]
MRRPRCPYCHRPVRRLWLRCRICRTRLAAWYALAVLAALVLMLLFAFVFFREAV